MKVMISAGESSGDRLGAGLAEELRRREPSIELVGMGGPKMRAAGVRLVQDAAEISVVGFSEVVPRLPQILRAKKRLETVLEQERPDLLVPIDFPDFNLRLSADAGRHGVGVVFFVSPQLWAWRSGRVKRIRELVREMLVLFEFETRFYEQAGVPVTWVGHPLAERSADAPDTAALRRGAGLSETGQVVALAPGSRAGEIGRHLPLLLAAAGRLLDGHPDLEFLLPLAPSAPEAVVRERVESSGIESIRIHAGGFPEILTVCAAGAVASGTATLEAATAGLPMVVFYRMNRLSSWIGKRMLQVDYVAMPNLIAGRGILPELLQDDCTPERLAAEIARYLDDAGRVAEVREGLDGVVRSLGEPGIFERAAERVLARAKSRV